MIRSAVTAIRKESIAKYPPKISPILPEVRGYANGDQGFSNNLLDQGKAY
ncbi:MAG: hypothetical protein MJA27_10275 [Pseudanabaenales cyanobacterium]|nr:hypothetical protein [Pseudanabaenales cyanobacterium]